MQTFAEAHPPGDALPLSGLGHLVLTVSDMEDSAGFWEDVFGFSRIRRVDEPAGRQQQPRILLRHRDCGFVLVVQQPHGRTGSRFDPAHLGLDHFSLNVPDHEALLAWTARLDEAGVARSPVREIEPARFVTFADPDGIQCELWCTRTDHAADRPSYAAPTPPDEEPESGMATTGAATTAAEDSLMRLEDRRIEAINTNDLDALRVILASDYQHCHANGLVQGREEILANLAANPRRIEPRSPEVRAYATGAVLTGAMQNVRTLEDGQTMTSTLSVTQVAELRDGRWQFVWFHGTRILG